MPHGVAQVNAADFRQCAADLSAAACAVTNPDRAEMGIPNHDTIRTDHKVVTEIVDFVIHLSSIRELKIDFWIQGASHKAKPHGYDGAVIIWGIRDTPPETPDQLEHHTMASRTPFTLHFDEPERGKMVYAGLCVAE
jgi:hypothetical protein